MTHIDPELIRQEEELTNIPLVPYLGRFNRERSLAKTLLDDERMKSCTSWAETRESDNTFKQSNLSTKCVLPYFQFLEESGQGGGDPVFQAKKNKSVGDNARDSMFKASATWPRSVLGHFNPVLLASGYGDL
ncbi:MAG: hypothetical protein U0V70_03085 [Terriglobia bacterium]